GQAHSVIFYFQFEAVRQKTQAHPSLPCTRMSRNIVQSFLQDAVDVYAGAAIYRKRHALLIIRYGNPGLPFHGGNVPVEGALESSLVEHHGMQRLGQTSHALECRLGNLTNL